MLRLGVTTGMIEERSSGTRRQPIVGLLGAAMDLAILSLYLVFVHSQEGDNGNTIAIAASFIGLLAVLSICAAIASARGKPSRLLFLIAGALNVGIGVLSLPSIGFLFIVAGGLLLSAAHRPEAIPVITEKH